MKRLTFTLLLFIALMLPSVLVAGQKVPISNFKIISFQGEWRHDTLWVVGEIKNTGIMPAAPQLEVIARDEKGLLVDSHKFWPNSVNNVFPGASCGIKYPVTDNTNVKGIELKIISVKVWE